MTLSLDWSTAEVRHEHDTLRLLVKIVGGNPDRHWRDAFARLADEGDPFVASFRKAELAGSDTVSAWVGDAQDLDALKADLIELVAGANRESVKGREAEQTKATEEAERKQSLDARAAEMTKHLRGESE